MTDNMSEEQIYKEGRMLNSSYGNYKIPTALDLPLTKIIFVESISSKITSPRLYIFFDETFNILLISLFSRLEKKYTFLKNLKYSSLIFVFINIFYIFLSQPH